MAGAEIGADATEPFFTKRGDHFRRCEREIYGLERRVRPTKGCKAVNFFIFGNADMAGNPVEINFLSIVQA